jgi:sarcosine oxidase / L-pipecolate oxidase
VNAREGLRRRATEAINLGANYICGDAGHAVQLLFDESSRCIGAKCNDGTTHFGSHIVLAAGAAAGTLLDLEGQIVAKAHSVCHIQLSPEESEKYEDLPIICHMEEGELAGRFIEIQSHPSAHAHRVA